MSLATTDNVCEIAMMNYCFELLHEIVTRTTVIVTMATTILFTCSSICDIRYLREGLITVQARSQS